MTPSISNKPSIQKIQEVQGFDAAGKPYTWELVTFMVGTHGPFTEKFPKEGFTAQSVQAKLQEFASHIATLAG